MRFDLKGGGKAELRPLGQGDDVFALASFINSMVEERVYLSIDRKVSIEEEGAWLEGKLKDIQNNEVMDWRLWLGGKCIGGVEARRGKWKEAGNVELGIALSEEARGQGIGTKLLEVAIGEVRKKWVPKNIVIAVYSMNKGAKKLYERVGFREFARFPEWVCHFGEYGEKIWLRLEE